MGARPLFDPVCTTATQSHCLLSPESIISIHYGSTTLTAWPQYAPPAVKTRADVIFHYYQEDGCCGCSDCVKTVHASLGIYIYFNCEFTKSSLWCNEKRLMQQFASFLYSNLLYFLNGRSRHQITLFLTDINYLSIPAYFRRFQP